MKDSKLTRDRADGEASMGGVRRLTVACILCLKSAGMNWFDAVPRIFALSLGDSRPTTPASVTSIHGHRAVLIVFQVLAALNSRLTFWPGASAACALLP